MKVRRFTHRATLSLTLSLLAVACSAEPQQALPESAVPSTAQQIVSAVATTPVTNQAEPTAPRVDGARAREVLFPEGIPVGCETDDVRCHLARRLLAHEPERNDALVLLDELGDVVGTESERSIDGGFRGRIRLVPQLPVGEYRKHLTWVLAAQRDIASFVRAIEAKAISPLRYRHRAILWKFMRSVGRTTPSAYANDWEIAYNVVGSLHRSQTAVRETIFHEIFHLNDQEHGNWSRRRLGSIVDGIAQRCGTNTPCLTPYAPFKTKVRGGTYYAFQPNNGDLAHEYSAELATRYFLEQLSAMRNESYPGGWFKCRTPENAEAFAALAEEFFGGVDLTPPCSVTPGRRR